MLWSHSLPGQQVQFQLSLIVIMNLCAADNSSLHPLINQGKNPWLVPRADNFNQHSQNKVARNILLGLYLAHSLGLHEIKQHIYWVAAVRAGSNEGHQRQSVLFTDLPTVANPSNEVITGRTFKFIFHLIKFRVLSAYPDSSLSSPCCF